MLPNFSAYSNFIHSYFISKAKPCEMRYLLLSMSVFQLMLTLQIQKIIGPLLTRYTESGKTCTTDLQNLKVTGVWKRHLNAKHVTSVLHKRNIHKYMKDATLERDHTTAKLVTNG